MKSNTTLIMAALSCVAVFGGSGCQTNRLAESDLARLQDMHADLTANYDKESRLLLRVVESQSIRADAAELKLALAQTAVDGKVPVELAQGAITDLVKRQGKTSTVIDNTRDKLAFLQAQSERWTALSYTLQTFISGTKDVFTLLGNAIKKAPAPTTAPADPSPPAAAAAQQAIRALEDL